MRAGLFEFEHRSGLEHLAPVRDGYGPGTRGILRLPTKRKIEKRASMIHWLASHEHSVFPLSAKPVLYDSLAGVSPTKLSCDNQIQVDDVSG